MKKLKEKGFSLLEAVLYLAIVSILLTAVVNFHLTLGGTSSKLSSNIDTSRNRRTALSKIDYLVKNADGFLKDNNGDCSDFSSSPNVLALYFEDDTYLPGTCVSSGGGVKITVDDNTVKMTCYPDITNNREYDSCNTASGNIYNLTASDVLVANTGLTFSTSTPTSTSSSFISLVTNFTAIAFSNNQAQLRSTSTATSTVSLRNEQPNGLVAWYKFDDADTSISVDSAGDNDATCYNTPTSVDGLMQGSSGAFDFEKDNNEYCEDGNSDDLNFDTQLGFTLSAWVNVDSTTNNKIHPIVSKLDNDTNTGYLLAVKNDSGTKTFICVYCDGSSCDEPVESNTIGTGTVYFLVCGFDPMYYNIVLSVDGNLNMSSFSNPSDPYFLVNSGTNLQIASTTYSNHDYFDGYIDDVRLYNRFLSVSERSALQSQED